jgi:hypothetical protein
VLFRSPAPPRGRSRRRALPTSRQPSYPDTAAATEPQNSRPPQNQSIPRRTVANSFRAGQRVASRVPGYRLRSPERVGVQRDPWVGAGGHGADPRGSCKSCQSSTNPGTAAEGARPTCSSCHGRRDPYRMAGCARPSRQGSPHWPTRSPSSGPSMLAGGAKWIPSSAATFCVPNMSRDWRTTCARARFVLRLVTSSASGAPGPIWYAKCRLPDGRRVQKQIGRAWSDRSRLAGRSVHEAALLDVHAARNEVRQLLFVIDGSQALR